MCIRDRYQRRVRGQPGVMACDSAGFSSPPVVVLACLAVLGQCLWGSWTRSLALGVVYLVSGGVLSVLENAIIGSLYSLHPDVYRRYTGFTSRYMLVHPLLLGMLVSSGWGMLGLQWADGDWSGVKFGVALAACGSLPVYTLGFASHRTPDAVVVAWQIHTAAQLVLGGVMLDLHVVL
eukprot:TRINITY_DN28230_c0_g1_i2.p1 TRINITY_DN28230_c0_g1~~TRINITY_DN28230_c0_g1_i2.p1  ORF type:complete len:178 (+),score=30.65 TRINITY_DN28230_c0_g1_i2:187-720(+)